MLQKDKGQGPKLGVNILNLRMTTKDEIEFSHLFGPDRWRYRVMHIFGVPDKLYFMRPFFQSPEGAAAGHPVGRQHGTSRTTGLLQ